MKKGIYFAAFALLVTANAYSQTIYDAVKFTNQDLNGTARFVGMGGAMGALGANISTIKTNPAGIALYRSNDVMTSFGVSTDNVESTFVGKTFDSNRFRWSFDNMGFVYSSKISNISALRFVNFGFNYTRSKSFDKYMTMEGVLQKGVSQTAQMANKANQMLDQFDVDGDLMTITDGGKNPVNLKSNYVGWLPAVGWDGHLFSPADKGGYASFLPESDAWFNSREKGGIDQYDFNVSFNFSDRVYLGFTIGAYDVNYSKLSTYGEDYGNYMEGTTNYGNESYEMTTENKIDGSGVDFKFGAIFRPSDEFPLRFGVAVHSPVFYNLTIKTNVRSVSQIYSPNDKKVLKHVVDSYDYLNNLDYGYDFRLRTPWKYNFSLGYVFGSSVAFGAEYEYQDYSSMRFNYSDGASMHYENSTAEEMLKGVHSIRLGVEWKVIPQVAFRSGYNYISEAFESAAYKDLSPNSIHTDTDFANTKAQNNYTLGMGYQGRCFYADLAYQYSTYKANFFAFDHVDLPVTKVTNARSQVLLTLGMRF